MTMAQGSGDSAYDLDTGLLPILPSNYASLSTSGKRRARSVKLKKLASVHLKFALLAELPDNALQSPELGDEKHKKRGTDVVNRCWEPYKFFACGHFDRTHCRICSWHMIHKGPVPKCPYVRRLEAGLWYADEFCKFELHDCPKCGVQRYRAWDGPIRYSLLIAAFKNEIQLDMLGEPSEDDYRQIWMDLRSRNMLSKDRRHEPLTMRDVWDFEAERCRLLVEKKSVTSREKSRMMWHGQKILDELCTYR